MNTCPTAAGPPATLAQCRQAARSVRGAEFGREAISAVRPAGITGIFRARAPLFIMLYLAARDGHLVWRGPHSFALLQPAADEAPGPTGATDPLRTLDRYWEPLHLAAPPVLLMLAAVLVLAARNLMGGGTALTIGLLLTSAALAYIAMGLASLALFALRWLYRELRDAATPTGALTAQLPPEPHWSMILCHHIDPPRTPPPRTNPPQAGPPPAGPHGATLLSEVAVRLAGLWAAQDTATRSLVCRRASITTGRMREVVTGWDRAVLGSDQSRLRLTTDDDGPAPVAVALVVPAMRSPAFDEVLGPVTR